VAAQNFMKNPMLEKHFQAISAKADVGVAFTNPDYKTSEKSSKNLWHMGFCADY
jgi:hypothetical protein